MLGRGLRVLDAGERDRDLVAGLLADLRLTHAELVDARADDRDRLVDLRVGGRVLGVARHGLEDDLEAALEVQAEHRRLHPRHDARKPEQDEHGQQDQVILGSVGHADTHTSGPAAQVPAMAAGRAWSYSAGSGSSAISAARRAPHAPGDGPPRDADHHVGGDLEPHLVAVERDDRAVDAAERDDLIAGRERAEQLALARHHAPARADEEEPAQQRQADDPDDGDFRLAH